MRLLGGIDIGGTKCAVTLGRSTGGEIEVIAKQRFPTPASPLEALKAMTDALQELLFERSARLPAKASQESSSDPSTGDSPEKLSAIGISCGGPLNSKAGLVLGPPNLPGWDRVDVVGPFQDHFHVPVGLQNDANACALAEWKWGAGRGYSNLIFLTFGTGMGAGLILDGRLYSGTNDMGGEVGHVRLAEEGPIGYGKAGSFEGFCSGGGIAHLARQMAHANIVRGTPVAFCNALSDLDHVTAATVAQAANDGDPLANEVFRISGQRLGQGISALIDILNPERIIIGSIYQRQEALLRPHMLEQIAREAIPLSASVCEVVPAALGDAVGDLASLSVAEYICEQGGSK
jgi:glucokinase